MSCIWIICRRRDDEQKSKSKYYSSYFHCHTHNCNIYYCKNRTLTIIRTLAWHGLLHKLYTELTRIYTNYTLIMWFVWSLCEFGVWLVKILCCSWWKLVWRSVSGGKLLVCSALWRSVWSPCGHRPLHKPLHGLSTDLTQTHFHRITFVTLTSTPIMLR